MTITLKNLHEATAQQVFDQIARHLLTQNKQARGLTNHAGCSYRFENLKCAAGCLIADDEYKPEMEGKGWGTLVARASVPQVHVNLINKLQRIHDSFDPYYWKEQLRDVAAVEGFNTEVLNQFTTNS